MAWLRTHRSWLLPALLFLLTLLSTLYAGSRMLVSELKPSPSLWEGWVFALPMMAILFAHEMGHYIAGRVHGVDISLPYFIPVPFFLFGTMGAVIRMREQIRSRNVLFDVGASGPYAGLAVTLPVLVVGLLQSPIAKLPSEGYLLEGQSLLYAALRWSVKGPIPEGYDVMLNPCALAGWAGLLVTMINLLPVGQLDGGHVAYAWLGSRQNRISEQVRRALPKLALLIGVFYALAAYLRGARFELWLRELSAGVQWLIWAAFLWLMVRGGKEHPPTSPGELSPLRRRLAGATALLFALLFMPSWMRVY